MKAFISYSVSGDNEYILPLLSSKLREKKFAVTTSQNFYSQEIDYGTMSDIRSSHLFIGIITAGGKEYQRVLEERTYAISQGIPNLLLIEEGVILSEVVGGNIIKFNSQSPKTAIDEINNRIYSSTSKQKSTFEALPWVLGGVALASVVAAFSKA
jgi:hypothetical protein